MSNRSPPIVENRLIVLEKGTWTKITQQSPVCVCVCVCAKWDTVLSDQECKRAASANERGSRPK